MALRFDALFVHPNQSFPNAFAQSLWPELQCAVIAHVQTLPEAFQKQVGHAFNLCFVAVSPDDDLNAFFKDMETLGRLKSCFFFQLVSQNSEPMSQPSHSAFSGVISYQPTAVERAMIIDMLKLEFHRQEVSRRVEDVREAVSLLIREVDVMARERQRGRKGSYDSAIKNFVNMHLSFDQDIYGEYIGALTELASVSEAFAANKVDIPDKVLEKRLPNLTKESYSGPSKRVWNKLLKRFGQRSDQAT